MKELICIRHDLANLTYGEKYATERNYAIHNINKYYIEVCNNEKNYILSHKDNFITEEEYKELVIARRFKL